MRNAARALLITTILDVNILKVVENIFEPNDGPMFGHTKEDVQ